jgi:PHD/YefM family antitoxin component YafN of YafNO toxin-antitoxin module
MRLHESVRPISYLKSHASELIRDISKNKQTLLITHNGTAKVIIQDVAVYEQTKESLALLKILSQSVKSKNEGKHKPVHQAFDEVKQKYCTVK